MKKLNERKQGVAPDIVVYNPIDLFTQYKFNNSQYVNIGYIKDEVTLSSGKNSMVKKVINITPETDAKLTEYIETVTYPTIKQRLIDFQNSDDYQNLLAGNGKSKNAVIDFTGAKIICVERFNFQWKDPKLFAKYYQKNQEKEWGIRKKYGFSDGFGRDEEMEDPEYTGTWRDKYAGGNIMPRSKNSAKGAAYVPSGIDNLYISLADSSKDELGMRIVFNPNTKNTLVTNYFVDGTGKLIEITPGFIEFLKSYKSQNRTAKAETPMSDEEKAFVKEIYDIDHTLSDDTIHEMTLKSSRILYVRGQVTPLRGSTKQSAIWINKKVVSRTFDYVDPSELTKLIISMTRGLKNDTLGEVVDGYIENVNVNGKSIADLISYDADGNIVADPATVRNRLGITEAIMNLYESY